MKAYVYQADLHCEDCLPTGCGRLPDADSNCCADGQRFDLGCDSDCCPQGPYPDGGGEADSPQHCGSCGVFLENPLTDDGRAYVEARLDAYLAVGFGNPAVLKVWADFYEYLIPASIFEGLYEAVGHYLAAERRL